MIESIYLIQSPYNGLWLAYTNEYGNACVGPSDDRDTAIARLINGLIRGMRVSLANSVRVFDFRNGETEYT